MRNRRTKLRHFGGVTLKVNNPVDLSLKDPRAKTSFVKRAYRDRWYLLFLLPAAVLLILFCYLPLYGLLIAFQEYKIGASILSFDGSIQWVGLQNFAEFFNSYFSGRVIKNTLRLSLKFLLYGGWVSPLVAIFLNEIRVSWLKRTLQTSYYLPYFISTAIVVAVMSMLVGTNGPIGQITKLLGGKPTNLMNSADSFDALYVISGIWSGFGYSSVMYLAAISNVNVQLYEAVEMDGGNRFHRMLHVTLPAILPTFSILLILQVGGLMNSSYDKIVLMYNTYTMERADTIGTYIYRVGLKDARYSYTTAVGLFSNVINFILVWGANWVSNKVSSSGLW